MCGHLIKEHTPYRKLLTLEPILSPMIYYIQSSIQIALGPMCVAGFRIFYYAHVVWLGTLFFDNNDICKILHKSCIYIIYLGVTFINMRF